jgi:hypothetical protein
MAMPPNPQQDDQEREAERRANAMAEQLRKDAASWSAGRSDAAERHAEDFRVPIARPVPQPKKPAVPAKPAATAAAPQTKGKPFSMSYGGTTTADYIKYRLERRAK